ncbi:MAG: DUF1460 domain-containing protein [Dysgonomonas sp.]
MKFTNVILILLFSVISTNTAKASICYNKTDSLIYESYIQEFSSMQHSDISDLIASTALFFIDRPYVASTLDENSTEVLTINLHEFDCTTFVENCIALSKVIKSGDFSFSNYCNILTSMRYRNGKIDGYTSRLHYTSDWIYQNERNGLLKNISLNLNGNQIEKEINFMSNHSKLYKHLNNNQENLDRIKTVENEISQRNNYKIIPLQNIKTISNNIIDGEIIIFATNIGGLDYSHIGIAYHKDNKLRFIHASSMAKKVIIETKSLIDYCNNSKQCSGITVLCVTN